MRLPSISLQDFAYAAIMFAIVFGVTAWIAIGVTPPAPDQRRAVACAEMGGVWLRHEGLCIKTDSLVRME